jgi:hypothetical protein
MVSDELRWHVLKKPVAYMFGTAGVLPPMSQRTHAMRLVSQETGTGAAPSKPRGNHNERSE